MLPTSKRRIINTPSTPPNAASSGPPQIEWKCSLPPTCHSNPVHFPNIQSYESHYYTQHAHICNVDIEHCTKIFPSQWLLDCHLDQVHSELTRVKMERGLPVLHCLHPHCTTLFHSPSERTSHAIKTHAYPPNFFFQIVEQGIGELIRAGGPGASLLLQSPEDEGEGQLMDSEVPTLKCGASREREGSRYPVIINHLKRSRSTLDDTTDDDDDDDDTDLEDDPHAADNVTPYPSSSLTEDRRTQGAGESSLHQLSQKLDSLSLVPSAVRRNQRASSQQYPSSSLRPT
ncbi:hypothetical protein A4X13_0g3244 [Tilletia indica]|uniref:C2H2-type domain-containing protein n=1 Tax=Tilletia indica TaxID=43049 RepID=A0A177TKB2_9BASI|nr:hypothetical protein A4X13_0g3244 [Tilletia indica]